MKRSRDNLATNDNLDEGTRKGGKGGAEAASVGRRMGWVGVGGSSSIRRANKLEEAVQKNNNDNNANNSNNSGCTNETAVGR